VDWETNQFFDHSFESQGRFAGYFNRYAESIKPAGGNPAIPELNCKDFKTSAYDFLGRSQFNLPKQIHRFTVGLR
jgi:hypothetical protein